MPYIRYTRKAAALAAAVCLLAMLAGCTGHEPKGEPVTPQDGYFRIDASGFSNGEVRFFYYPVDGKPVVFMVARTSGGEIKTAFDACITCYPHKMGYRCESGRVVCIKCGTAFGLEELGVGKGNCVPIKIEHSIHDGKILIEKSEIDSGARWF